MDHLLVTKLSVPTVRHRLVERERLMCGLSDGLHARLILISAPAGFGKTTLFGEWRSRMAGAVDVAWITIDDYDNDLARIWRHVIASVEAATGCHADAAPSALQSNPPQPQAAIAALINALTSDDSERPLVIVLDDYQCITAPAVHESVAFALEHLPPRVHLAILTRADPPLGLARLRVRGELLELRAEQLSFAPDETRAFVRDVMGLAVDDCVLGELHARTEGWPAAIHLAALAVRGQPNPSAHLAELLKADQFIVDYLIEEVLRHQPKTMRDFLLHTSVLSDLCPALCDAVAARDDSAGILARLQHDGLFISPLDVRGEHSRYHPLFAAALRDLLRQTSPQIIPELHRRASDWHLAHGQALEAINHARQAGDFDRITRSIAHSYRDLIQAGELATLMRLLEEIPRERVEREPALAVAYAWSHIYALRFGDLERYLRLAEAAPPGGEVLRAEVLALRGVFESVYGDPLRARQWATAAAALADPDDVLVQMVVQQALGNAARNLGQPAEAIAHYERSQHIGQRAGWLVLTSLALARQAQMLMVCGRLREAATVLDQAACLTKPDGDEPSLFAPEVALLQAGCRYELNDMPEARALLRRGMALADRTSNRASLVYHALPAARILLACAEPEEARHMAEQVTDMAAQARSPLLVALAQLCTAHVAFALGDVRTAAAWVARYQAGELDAVLPPLQRDDAELLAARVHLAQGRCGLAERIARALAERAQEAGRITAAIGARIALALALQAAGRTDAARGAFVHAIESAAPHGFIRAFVDEGDPVRGQLRDARAALQRTPRKRGLLPYVDRLLTAAGEQAKASGGLIDPLTPREMQVLLMLARGASNGEIAARLVISAGTVKAHTNRIFGKLGVRNRTEAAARARELALVDA